MTKARTITPGPINRLMFPAACHTVSHYRAQTLAALLSVMLLVCCAPVLPAGLLDNWYAGDGHVHSEYSQWDIVYVRPLGFSKRPTVADMAQAALRQGLSWIIITDHETMFSKKHYYSGENARYAHQRWLSMSEDCRKIKDILVLPGEETGGLVPVPGYHSSHYLCYGINEWVKTDRSCAGMVARVKQRNGLGFIAHPNGSRRAYSHYTYNWVDLKSTAGYTGVELINYGMVADYAKPGHLWDRHLTGEIAARMDGLPLTTTHVGVANSDAHWPKSVGRGKTYVYLPAGLPPERDQAQAALFTALAQGRCVASDGPLLVCKLGEANIGDLITVAPGARLPLTIEWRSPLPLAAIKVIGRDGKILHCWSAGELAGLSGSKRLDLSFTDSGYVRVQGAARRHGLFKTTTQNVFTNPIWVKVTPPAMKLPNPEKLFKT